MKSGRLRIAVHEPIRFALVPVVINRGQETAMVQLFGCWRFHGYEPDPPWLGKGQSLTVGAQGRPTQADAIVVLRTGLLPRRGEVGRHCPGGLPSSCKRCRRACQAAASSTRTWP